MRLTYTPLLQTQRDLYDLPRGRERFDAYLQAMRGSLADDISLPLSAMNPMAGPHVPALLDDWLALDTDAVASEIVAELAGELAAFRGHDRIQRIAAEGSGPTASKAESAAAPPFQVGLVMADDVRGAWTNRYATEFDHRFRGRPMYRRGWIVGMLWSSEPASLASLRDELRTAAFRTAIISVRGEAQSLGEMLAQEGEVMARAGCRLADFEAGGSAPDSDAGATASTFDAAGLERIAVILRPRLEAEDRPTVMTCIFGDPAAEALGYPRLGLPRRAGLAWALAESNLAASESPEFQSPSVTSRGR